jgi:hypothetical protein
MLLKVEAILASQIAAGAGRLQQQGEFSHFLGHPILFASPVRPGTAIG